MSDPALELHDVGKRFRLFSRPGLRAIDALGGGWLLRGMGATSRELWAARHISFRVERGERVGLIGRNGAGKSTTLKMIIGTLTPTEGRVEVRGRIQALMEIGTGFHPEFTGRQNIQAALSYQGITGRDAHALEPEIIDFSELAEFIDQPVKTYSAGMYARLAFSAATAVIPDVLVIDEILGAGDAYFAGKCLDRMRDLTERSGTTVLFVSHDASAVQVLCQRCIWIERGTVKEDGPTLSVLKSYATQVRRDEEARLRARDARAAGEPRESPGSLPRDTSNYGSGACTIESVELEDADSSDAKIVLADRPCRVKVRVFAPSPISNPVFVFCAYLPSGLCAMQLVVAGEECGAPEISGSNRVEFVIDRLVLGAGEYVASVAVFERMPRLGAEPRAYHVMDRSFHFKVEDEAGPARVERGVCRQPFRAEVHAG
ncbi:MAG: ABC transporter ATP-binding protein [Phycisphaerales bacterium]|nr:ABC transporter ATP-binding protein [Planctomycetota bacterium]